MKNNGLFSSLFIEDLRNTIELDLAARGRMETLVKSCRANNLQDTNSNWEPFLNQALSYLEFATSEHSLGTNTYLLYEDWGFKKCISVLIFVPPGSDIDDASIGRFYPGKLLSQLKQYKLNWGILTNGSQWRLYSIKSSRPYEDYVEQSLAQTLDKSDETEYALFERFFHRDSFLATDVEDENAEHLKESVGISKCRLDLDREQSEQVLKVKVNTPFLGQVDEILQYICNGFIYEIKKSGDDYTEDNKTEIFQSAVKLIYRCLFLFYAEARRLLPTDLEKTSFYQKHSIQALCREAHKFRWRERDDTDQYDLWKRLKALIHAVNEGDQEYGIMGYNGGLFDDDEEHFLREHQLRNDFMSRALYLMAYVEPYSNEPYREYAIPYEDLEVRHLGELYENILECTVLLADADRIRRRTKNGVEIVLASQTAQKQGDSLIKKGEVYFGESILERKQTGSYYTPESLVRFLNNNSIVQPIDWKFEQNYRKRFNEFLAIAQNAHLKSIRLGAAQSALALVERFVEKEVLNFKVCDPAMGSGHFLVDAANQMADLVVSLLAEISYVDEMTASVTNHPNYWRRLITRWCIYGVDINPLAVTLVKLSLWLNCFAVEHKLTFLDHHLRCGNSLIGIRSLAQLRSIPKRKIERKRKKGYQGLLFDLDDLSSALSEAGERIASITQIDEDDTERQKAFLDQALETTAHLHTLADLYTAYLMAPEFKSGEYRNYFEWLANGIHLRDTVEFSNPRNMTLIEELNKRYKFFHWPLEFPDLFRPANACGFSATIGNPPWDIVKRNSQEFFGNYDANFRSYKKAKANNVAQAIMNSNPKIREKWTLYCDEYKRLGNYYREPQAFSYIGKGHINTFKLFLEKFFILLKENGHMGIVVPSGFYLDLGCMELRKLFLNQSRIKFLYSFENRWPTVFTSVHPGFKFVVFVTRKGGISDDFKCVFMEHNPQRLPHLDANALSLSPSNIEKFSPKSLSIMEFRNQKDIDTASKIYGRHPFLGQYLKANWNTKFQREFNMSEDSDLFMTKDGIADSDSLPLWEGKQIWILTNQWLEPTLWMNRSDALTKPTTKTTRLVYRAVASNTNARTFIPTVIPMNYPVGNSLNVCPLPPRVAVLLTAILGSFVIDWTLRSKVTTNVNMFIVEQLPIADVQSKTKRVELISDAIISRGCRLVCNSNSFSEIWKTCFNENWLFPDFWYSNYNNNKYGPAHEQEIRNRLYWSARNLTCEWTKECSLYDSLPKLGDTGDRSQIRAEIDAYVAHLYNLTRGEFSYVLDDFPVLRNQEERNLGEFKSKRKCLEEFDRLSDYL